MNRLTRFSQLLIIAAALTLLGAGEAAPPGAVVTKSFSVGSSYGARTIFSLTVREPGCIQARATWSGNARTLAVILNGPGRTSAYKRQDGGSGVVLAYSATATDVSRGTGWSITISNFGGGTASGSVTIEYPPTQTPCEVKAAPGSRAGQVVLSWKYTGKTLPGRFLAQRRTDNNIVCQVRPSTSQTAYSCTDSGLRSKTIYTYRVCSVSATASQCSASNVSPTVSVTAP